MGLVGRLETINREAARLEFATWTQYDGVLFERLRIWGAGRAGLTTAREAEAVFLGLADDTFWGSDHERDLYFSLHDRWAELSAACRKTIEDRILNGRIPWTDRADDPEVSGAYARLNAIEWFRSSGLEFGFDVQQETDRLRAIDRAWRPEFAGQTARPRMTGPYTVGVDSDPSSLERLPLDKILPIVVPAENVDRSSMRQPFLGFARKKPFRALAALRNAMSRGVAVTEAWNELLQATQERPYSRRFMQVVATLIPTLPDEQIARIWYALADWIGGQTLSALADSPQPYDALWRVILRALKSQPSPYKQKPKRRWVDEGLNAPAGRLAAAIFKDPAGKELEPDSGLPDGMKARLESLLGLPGDHRRHALAIICHSAAWIEQTDFNWARERLLPLATGDDKQDAAAFWEGFLWRGYVPKNRFLRLLKPAMLSRALEPSEGKRFDQNLAAMILIGWRRKAAEDVSAIVSGAELREAILAGDDNFRASILHHLGEFARQPDSDWLDEVVPFLRTVWPKQSALRTPTMSARLVGLALRVPAKFDEIVSVIGSRLLPGTGSQLNLMPDDLGGLLETNRDALLDVLVAVLPRDSRDWPWGMDTFVDSLAPTLESAEDPRTRELVRRRRSVT